MLMIGERALTLVELQQIDDILTIEAENRRLQSDAVRADREKMSTANRRLQSEQDENARLRKELEEARAKLDAIANIERSLNERKPSNEGRPQ
jgi:nucleoid-associated protein YgaU